MNLAPERDFDDDHPMWEVDDDDGRLPSERIMGKGPRSAEQELQDAYGSHAEAFCTFMRVEGKSNPLAGLLAWHRSREGMTGPLGEEDLRYLKASAAERKNLELPELVGYMMAAWERRIKD